MKRVVICGMMVAITSMLIGVSAFPTSSFLLWNRTESAPKGLYLRKNSPLTRSGWAVLSANAPAARWVSDNGYLARGWPIIKRVRGLSGDEICRTYTQILINGEVAATALLADRSGKKLPTWSGCVLLNEDQVFLLNDHPRSLDGRYFGPTPVYDLDGSADLVWSVE